MAFIIQSIGSIFGMVMHLCYSLAGNYGIAILLFTLLTKIIMLPVSLWVHANGIKVLKIQPEINRINIRFFGDKDTISEKQAELYKKERYNPLASLIPLAIQILFLIGVIEVIYHPLTYLLRLDQDCINAYLASANSMYGIDVNASNAQLKLLNLIQNGCGSAIAEGVSERWQSSLYVLQSFDTRFLGIDLTWIAIELSGLYYIIPLLTGGSALLMGLMQNKYNPLQHEQSKVMQWITNGLSVAIALYLGFFVPAGVALYWITGNLLVIAQQFLLNAIVDPRKHVDYQELQNTKNELESLNSIGIVVDPAKAKELHRRENQDYKRFFSILNKHLVFYSERNGFYKYFKDYIEYILDHSNLTIHYITSDPDDQIFKLADTQKKIRPYYIGEKKLITLMMKMDADMVVMTMPDLQNFHIKKSLVREDIEYLFIPHGIGSYNLLMRKGATHHFDSMFCFGPTQKREEQKIEAYYHLPSRKLIEVGYPLIDNLRKTYSTMDHHAHQQKRILIAPSWQKDNIIDTCIETILEKLKDKEYKIIVRPHPQEVRLKKTYIDAIKDKYSSENVEIQTDFASNNPLLEADLLITDWSSIGTEYAFSTYRPVLYINTPMKIMNPDYKCIDEPPIDIELRNLIGINLDLDDLDSIDTKVSYLINRSQEYHDSIEKIAHQYMYNLDVSAQVGGAYIINTIQKIVKEKGKRK